MELSEQNIKGPIECMVNREKGLMDALMYDIIEGIKEWKLDEEIDSENGKKKKEGVDIIKAKINDLIDQNIFSEWKQNQQNEYLNRLDKQQQDEMDRQMNEGFK